MKKEQGQKSNSLPSTSMEVALAPQGPSPLHEEAFNKVSEDLRERQQEAFAREKERTPEARQFDKNLHNEARVNPSRIRAAPSKK